MNNHYDVGIVGCWYWGNYGSILNGYATFKLIQNLGKKVLNIVTPNNGFEPHAKRFFSKVYSGEDISDFMSFEELDSLNEICDSFVSGSDQIWKYNGYKSNRYENYFRLNFVRNDKKKISFATSFGNFSHKPTKSEIANFKELMERYSHISVRETEGVDICKNIFGIRATQIMEPTLLLTKETWEKISDYSECSEISEPYLLTYILDPTEEKRKAIEYYSKKLNVPYYNILDGFSAHHENNKKKLGLSNTLPNIACQDFLKYFKNAKYILTDSFHGAVFSIIFKKPFIVFSNINRGLNRFETLLNKLNLQGQLVNSQKIPLDSDLLTNVHYDNVDSILEKERERAISWLKNAFESDSDVRVPNVISSYLDSSLCVGCGSCVSICAKKAICLVPDKYGFYKYSIDEHKCNKCGLCIERCPAYGKIINLNAKTPYAYAYIDSNDEVLKQSTSGGAFNLLSKAVLDEGGVVVGAAWADDFKVQHTIIKNVKELDKLRKSKYLQSYMGSTYKSVKKYLDKGTLVLFTGCPCQVAGLKQYLGAYYSNLITVDLFCAGCPSPLYFKKYIDEKYGIDRLTSYEFRYKNCNDAVWSPNYEKVVFSDGTESIEYQKEYDYYPNLLLMVPDQCRKCKYQGTTRIGDFTIGDCWGVQIFDQTLPTGLGVSTILVNNAHSLDWLTNVAEKYQIKLYDEPIEQIKKYNVCTFQDIRTWPIGNKSIFRESILNDSFSKSIRKALK